MASDSQEIEARYQQKLGARAKGTTEVVVTPAAAPARPERVRDDISASYEAKLAERAKVTEPAAPKGGDGVGNAFDASAVDVTEAGLAGLKLDQLQAVAALRGVNVEGLRSKKEIAEALLTEPAAPKGGDGVGK